MWAWGNASILNKLEYHRHLHKMMKQLLVESFDIGRGTKGAMSTGERRTRFKKVFGFEP